MIIRTFIDKLVDFSVTIFTRIPIFRELRVHILIVIFELFIGRHSGIKESKI